MEYTVKWMSLILFLQLTVLILSEKNNGDLKNSCRKCKPGYYAVRKCNAVHDTICSRCHDGTFTVHYNRAPKCHDCSLCGPDSYTIRPCTRTSDTVCSLCSSAGDKRSSAYKIMCLGDYSELMLSDEGKITSYKTDDTLSEEGSGEDDKDEHKISIGNGIILLPTLSTGDLDVKPEIPEVDSHIPKNDSLSSENTDEVTGSGDVTLEIAEDSFNLTNWPEVDSGSAEIKGMFDTTSPVSNLINETVLEKLLPVETEVPLSESETTSALPELPYFNDIVTDAEPEPIPEVQTTPAVLTVKSTTQSKELTSLKTGMIDIGYGVHIEQSEETTTEKIKRPEHPGKRKGGHKNHLIPTAEPSVGEQSMDDDSQKVTIGVVVAVAIIAAVVFFVLGFIVSRYCRRKRHSFQVMKKVERDTSRNGGVPVPIGVEYRDPEAHNGIYDEIDRNGKSMCKPNLPLPEEIVPTTVDNVYAVPNKVKKGQESPVIEEQLDRIKFIDETTDEEFGGKDEEKMGLLGTIDRDLEKQKNGPKVLPTLNGSVPHIVDSHDTPEVDTSVKPETDIPSTQEPDLDKSEDNMTNLEDDFDTADDKSTSEASYHVDEKEEENIEYEDENMDESSPMLTKEDSGNDINEVIE